MKNRVVDGVEVWKQFEDLLIPGLRLSVIERAVYSHLLRHSRLEGKPRLKFSIGWCARGAGLSTFSVRKAVRRLAAKGALRLAERSKRGHTIEVRLPEEVRGVRARKIAEGKAERCAARQRIWRKPTFWKSERCGKRSTRARAATAFTAFGE